MERSNEIRSDWRRTISVSLFLEHAKELDITQVQLASLVIADTYPGIDQTSLSKAAALDRQTTSNVVSRLVTKGLLRRTEGERRTKRLYLTGAGQAIIEAVRPRVAPIRELMLQPLSETERQQFLKLLKKLVHENNELSRAPFSAVDGVSHRN